MSHAGPHAFRLVLTVALLLATIAVSPTSAAGSRTERPAVVVGLDAETGSPRTHVELSADRSIGDGFGTGTLYVMNRPRCFSADNPTPKPGDQRVVALDLGSERIRWTRDDAVIAGPYRGFGLGASPRRGLVLVEDVAPAAGELRTRALEPRTGLERWSSPRAITHVLASSDDIVLVADADPTGPPPTGGALIVRGLDPTTGRERWRRSYSDVEGFGGSAGDGLATVSIVHPAQVNRGSADVEIVDPVSGSIRRTVADVPFAPSLPSNTLGDVLVTTYISRTAGYSTIDGLQLWDVPDSIGRAVGAHLVTTTGHSAQDSSTSLRDPATGRTRWSVPLAASAEYATAKTVVLWGPDGFTAVAAATGRTRWHRRQIPNLSLREFDVVKAGITNAQLVATRGCPVSSAT
jgi:outer membrane protein assembly factor BamB